MGPICRDAHFMPLTGRYMHAGWDFISEEIEQFNLYSSNLEIKRTPLIHAVMHCSKPILDFCTATLGLVVKKQC